MSPLAASAGESRRRILVVALVLTILPLFLPSVVAQVGLDTTGRWQPLDPGIHPAPDGAPQGFSRVFFRDSLHGYLAGSNPSFGNHASSDGGETWSYLQASVPLPHTLFPSRFGFSPTGYITHDSGAVWTQLAIDHTDSALAGYGSISTMAAADRSAIVATADYDYSYYDESQQKMVYKGTTRLVISTDGGAHWLRADSIYIKDIGRGPEPLVARATGIGTLPVPDTVPTATTGWVRVLQMPDSVTCYVLSYATWVRPGEWTLHAQYYIGIIDLTTMSAEWHPVPMWRDIDPVTTEVEGFDVTWVDPYTALTRNPPYNRDNVNYELYRSFNGGRTWDRINTPSWLAARTARLFPPDTIIAGNGYTTNGTTWHARGNFLWGAGTDAANADADGIHVITPAHHIMVRNALIAHSYDTGRTWRRNHTWEIPEAIAARDHHVVAGWSGRVIARSTDAGLTWSEAGVDGSDIPERVRDIYAIAFVNAGHDVEELIAVVQFAKDSSTYFGTIRSTDGGATWREDARLPWLDDYFVARDPRSSLTPPSIQFVASGTGTRGVISGWGLPLVTTDGGRTWIGQGPSKITSLVMADAERAFGCYYSRGDSINIFSTLDGGATWERRYTGSMSSLVGIDALNRNDYRILCRDDELRSTDGGLTWSVTHHGKSLGGKVLRLDSLQLYLLLDTYWKYSDDAGSSYQSLAPYHSDYHGRISARDHDYIYLAGTSNKVARWRIADQTGAVPRDAGITTRGALLENIVGGDRARLRLDLDRATLVGIAIVDMLGREVGKRNEVMVEAGAHEMEILLDELAGGRYLVTLRIDGAVEAHPLVIMR